VTALQLVVNTPHGGAWFDEKLSARRLTNRIPPLPQWLPRGPAGGMPRCTQSGECAFAPACGMSQKHHARNQHEVRITASVTKPAWLNGNAAHRSKELLSDEALRRTQPSMIEKPT